MGASDVRRRAEQWMQGDPDAETAAELAELLARDDQAELVERCGTQLAFGTAGLRGILGAGSNRMNRAVVRRTAAGLAKYLQAQVPEASTRGVVVGWDGRRMSREFAHDVAGVLASHGFRVRPFSREVPTPLVPFTTAQLGAAAGVMITASHNPPEYNGFKVYWSNAAQLTAPHDKGISAAIDAAGPANQLKLLEADEARQLGLWLPVPDSLEKDYLDAVVALRRHPEAKGLSIVYTAMHGVGGRFADVALARAGFTEVHRVVEQHQPDGAFPTVRFPNPEEPGALDLATALAEKVGADLVLANDPDADRLAAMARTSDGKLRALSGNELGVLLGHYLLTQTQPAPARPVVLTTIVSSCQLKHLAAALGADYDETLTGFKWIANRGLEQVAQGKTLVFSYEEALGYSVGTLVRDKDGISAALVCADMAAWCRARGTTLLGYLEELQRRHGLFVSKQANFTFPGVRGTAVIRDIMDGFRQRPPARLGGHDVVATSDYQKQLRTSGSGAGGTSTPLTLPRSDVLAFELEGGGRVTLRPSGTEPKLKYYFELVERLDGAGEALEAARARALDKLSALEKEVLTLARERGQP